MDLNEAPQRIDDNNEIIKEKEEQNERIEMLRGALEEAVCELGYGVEVPHTLRGVCKCYCGVIRSIQEECVRRMSRKNEEPNLQCLKYKVELVRRQNRELRKRIQKIYE